MEVPRNKEAERALLSCCIGNGDEMKFEKAAKLIDTEDFYYEDHQVIWDALKSLSSESSTIDIITVCDKVRATNEELFHTTLELDGSDVSRVAFNEYIDIILKKSKLRAMRREYTLALEKISSDKSPDVILDEVSKELDKFTPREKEVTHIKNSLDIIKDELDSMARGDYKPNYIKTHFKHLDSKIKLESGSVFTIAAPTSVGKSALSLNIALRAASRDGISTLIFSLEMPQKQISKRMIGTLSNLDLQRTEEQIETPANLKKINESIDKLKNIPIHTIHTIKSINALAADVRRFKREKDIKLVVIDYLQLIPFDSGRMGKADGIAMISQKVKQIALENDVAVLLLSQLNREGARSDRPDLYHLKDSGSIENDADIVLIMNCKDNDPEAAKSADDYGPYMTINYLIAKNREGERGVRDYFKFYFKEGRFF